MVHYIRLLKPPKLQFNGKTHQIVKALITITTDLGDDFFPSDLPLWAKLISSTQHDTRNEYQFACWKAGMRALWVEVDARLVIDIRSWRLLIAAAGQEAGAAFNSLCPTTLCDIVTFRSDIVAEHVRTKDVSVRVERTFVLSPGNHLSIIEDTRESIARHIWDAGIALVAFLANLPRASANELPAPLSHLLPAGEAFKVLELGSGCGIVGIAFAQLFAGCDVVLTDLPEALEILDVNIRHAAPAVQSKLTRRVLDWGEELPVDVQDTTFDLVFVSDCTYNCDSIPDLVKTISALAAGSPDPLVFISLKKRHSSEAVLFDLLDAAGLIEVFHTSVQLPDRGRAAIEETLEHVEIMAYRFRREKRKELKEEASGTNNHRFYDHM